MAVAILQMYHLNVHILYIVAIEKHKTRIRRENSILAEEECGNVVLFKHDLC